MKIDLQVRGTEQVRWALDMMGERDAKEAVRMWTNWVGLEAQGEMRRVLPSRFSFRGTSEGFQKAIVFQQSRTRGTRDIQAELKVGGPGFGQSRTQNLGVILARHEDANTRTRTSAGGLADLVRVNGGRLIEGGFFMPANGMRTASANPPRSLYPRAIGVQMRADASNRMFFAKGTKGKGRAKVSYFATEQGVFRRAATRAAGQREVQAIWWFRRTVRTPARLGLWVTAQEVFNRRAVDLGLQAVQETLFRKANAFGQFSTRGGR